MSDIKWIKLYVDVTNNKKINSIRRLPGGNDIALIWFFLLATAGDCNKNGGLFITDTIPYREEDFAAEYGFEVQQIRFALLTLEKYEMIEVFDDVVWIKNWEEYQNIEGMDKIREQTRLRNIEYRKRKKLEQRDASVTSRDAIELEQDKELEKDKYKYSLSQMRLAEFLLSRIRDNIPNLKQPNLDSWANEIRLMVDRDHREENDIHVVIDWCQHDSFWKANILSAKKLREKFDQLTAKMNCRQPAKKSAAQRFMECDDIEPGRNETDIDIHSERIF